MGNSSSSTKQDSSTEQDSYELKGVPNSDQALVRNVHNHVYNQVLQEVQDDQENQHLSEEQRWTRLNLLSSIAMNEFMDEIGFGSCKSSLDESSSGYDI